MATSTTKTERLNLRTTQDQVALIRRAAALKGQNVTEFVLSCATTGAERTIDEAERMALNAHDRAVFVDALLDPPAPGRKARAAARRYQKLSNAQAG